MFGSHLSVAGGLYKALLSAEKYAMETVQVFTNMPPFTKARRQTTMTFYEFEPSKRRGRNRYVGKWTETPSEPINLPFTDKSLGQVLAWGASPETSPYSHQDISHWCSELCQAARSQYDAGFEQTLSERAREIAEDVHVQWDLYLANTYSFEQLTKMDHGTVQLPPEWFECWLGKLGSSA
jgi:hypothetical protein